jgi:hypothetical protein
MNEIRPTYGHGTWIANHRFLRKSAYRAKDDFQNTHSRFLELKSGYDSEVPQELADPEFAELRERVYQCEQSTLLYCCMAVEAYLNYYGVRKFGEKFYKRNLERSGIWVWV